jgi:hypothetical protein
MVYETSVTGFLASRKLDVLPSLGKGFETPPLLDPLNSGGG